ncbi:MAG: HAD-IIA family hydrolase [Oscillospiraceae bacterium]
MKDTLQSCKMFVFDLDGTLYLGDEILPGAHEIIEALDKAGICYIYLTNNSSRAAADYVTRLERMGFPCTKANVMSSSMATAEYLKENYPCQDVYLVGTDALYDELKAGGLLLSDTDPGVVCVGFDTQLTYDKLNKATHFLRRGAAFVAANPDCTCPMPNDEVLPDCGGICALLTACTGREPFYIGKPNPQMLLMLSKQHGIPLSQIAVVGDRLYTDIAVAENAGAVSVCVLSGETNREMIKSSPVKPQYVFDSVVELRAHLNL